MQDAVNSIESVAEQIDALEGIAQAAVPGAPLVSAFLQAALDTLAAHGGSLAPADAMDSTQSLSHGKPPRKPRPRDPLDGLGGGKLLE